MRYLFAAWESVEKKLRRAKKILLCADFDGTLAPIRPRPKEASLDQNSRLLLRKVARNESFVVGIISGRALKDLKQKLAIKGLILAGNHGLEITYKKENFIYPAAKRSIPVIFEIGQRLTKGLAPFPGAVLEKKRFSLSLHYRLVKPEELSKLKKVFLQVARPYLVTRKVRLTYGKKVWELRPPIQWDKGRALLWLVKRLRRKRMLTIYIGDDLTDEDAFRAVNRIGGVSIFVGRKRQSLARYYLKSTKETQEFLRKILCKK